MTSITNTQAYEATEKALGFMQKEFGAAGWDYAFRKQSAMGEWAWTKGSTTICIEGWHGRDAATHGIHGKIFGRVHMYQNDRPSMSTDEPSYPSGRVGMPDLVASGRKSFQLHDSDASFYTTTVLPKIAEAVREYRAASDVQAESPPPVRPCQT